ncbi:hypothetical protein BJY04DRAFT_22938 [Aspergillus karnatakaensis]|uniref:uncharacterized protein n=1 Tax=Aspergillus karnatakaensis TaxID=1810916 RepID=UPI003CCD07C7
MLTDVKNQHVDDLLALCLTPWASPVSGRACWLKKSAHTVGQLPLGHATSKVT